MKMTFEPPDNQAHGSSVFYVHEQRQFQVDVTCRSATMTRSACGMRPQRTY